MTNIYGIKKIKNHATYRMTEGKKIIGYINNIKLI